MTAATPALTPRRRRRWARIVLGVFGAVFIVVVIGAIALYRLAVSTPSWWAPIDPADPAAIQTARDVENSVTNLVHQARPPEATAGVTERGTWSIRMTEAEANAWLAARLPAWVANQSDEFSWPAELSPPQVRLQDGRATIGVTLGQGGGAGRGEVLSTTLTPEIGADGALWLRAGSFSLGRLGVPASWVLSRSSTLLGAKAGADATRVLDALAGKHPIVTHPVVRLSDGRHVRLLKIALNPGAITVTCRTEPPSR